MKDRDAFYVDVGKAIRRLREERGLTQTDLGTAVGLTRTSISNVEKGRQKMLLHTFYDVAETLMADLSTILPRQGQAITSEEQKLPTNISPSEREFIETGLGMGKKGG
ncbi:MAG: helix-turn-helix domain-containing protein [Chloroflexi bacterium]|nr:helix-turn-helix domain-containing protein [Chloroflexota bacterium]